MKEADRKIKTEVYKNGELVEVAFEDIAVPEPTQSVKHPLDDDRELKEEDGTDFNGQQRFAQFNFLENRHIYERQYPPIEEQLDMLYWDKINSTDKWKEAIDKIKTDTPKTDTSDMSKVKDEFGN